MCSFIVSKRSRLIKHYKLKHYHFGQRHYYPCTYYECPCTFKTLNALKCHLSHYHSISSYSTNKSVVFTCNLCPERCLTSSKAFFSHIGIHLKSNETATCMFQDCSFQSNVYGTFRSHRNRKHAGFALSDFKPGVIKKTVAEACHLSEEHFSHTEDLSCDPSDHNPINAETEENLEETIIEKFASLLLKLKVVSHVLLLMNY